MKWARTDNGSTETYTLTDSMDQDLAEVFKVEDDEWHLNVLDVMYDVKTCKNDAMREVYQCLGIRPER